MDWEAALLFAIRAQRQAASAAADAQRHTATASRINRSESSPFAAQPTEEGVHASLAKARAAAEKALQWSGLALRWVQLAGEVPGDEGDREMWRLNLARETDEFQLACDSYGRLVVPDGHMDHKVSGGLVT